MKRIIIIAALLLAALQLSGAEWQAKWISRAYASGMGNTWLAFQKKVDIETVPAELPARIAADSKYWLWVNGEMVVFEGGLKRGPAPGDGYYDTVDIAPFLKSGQNVISVALGANGTLSPADVKPRLKDLKGAAALLMQLETPIPTVLAAAKAAKAAGVMVVLNPAPAAKLPKELYPLIDWITPNETEAELLTGVKVNDAKSAQLAVDALKRKGVKNVAITMGAKGVYCGNCRRLYPAKKVKAVDCVAAGDTFNGAFVVALAEGKSCRDAIAFAQKASAISVTRPGAQSSVPRRREVK